MFLHSMVILNCRVCGNFNAKQFRILMFFQVLLIFFHFFNFGLGAAEYFEDLSLDQL